jgi:hypothetical protein
MKVLVFALSVLLLPLLPLSALCQPKLSAAMTEEDHRVFAKEEAQCLAKTKRQRVVEFAKLYESQMESLNDVYEVMGVALKRGDAFKLRRLHDVVRRIKGLPIGDCLASARVPAVLKANENLVKAQEGLDQFLVYARQGEAVVPFLNRYLSALESNKLLLRSLQQSAKHFNG